MHCKYASLLLSASACTTLNIQEIENLKKVQFEQLRLRPDYEPNSLRIDLIRQKYQVFINDSTSETNKVVYFPLGFALGNGIFYDLNRNLVMRIDRLTEFSPGKEFLIKEINRPDKNKGIVTYSFRNDSLTYKKFPGEKVHYVYHLVREENSIFYKHKNRLKYVIIRTDSSMSYSRRGKKMKTIYDKGAGQYFVDKPKKKNFFRMCENEIFMGKDYKVSLENDSSAIFISTIRSGRILYTIERSSDKIYIYRPNYSGLKIDLSGNKMLLYRGKKLLVSYELIHPSGIRE